MYTSLQAFQSGIDGLVSYIELEESKDEFFRDGYLRHGRREESAVEFDFFVIAIVAPGATNGKRFLYNSMIVSLYGYLESFIESLVEEYVSRLSTDCKNFLDVPAKVRDQHLELSIDLIKAVRRDRNLSKDEKALTIKRIVGNMNSCICESDDFSLNDDAYSIHTANFRYESIHTIFQRAGIDGILRSAIEIDNLREKIAEINLLTAPYEKKILISMVTSELDDLAQRRNEISHGSLNSDLQSLELFKERAGFIHCLGSAIHNVVENISNEFRFKVIKSFCVGCPDKIFQNKNVFGYFFKKTTVTPPDLSVSVGDELFSFNVNSSQKLIVGKIISLVCNGYSVDSVLFVKDLSLGIQVDFKVTSHMANREIFLRV